MKVAIFCDSEKILEVEKIRTIITSYDASVIIYDDASISTLQKEMTSPHAIMEDVTHVLFLYSASALSNTNFIFFSGYALGAGLPMLLISEIADPHLPDIWRNLFILLDLSSFDSYFEGEKKSFLEKKQKEIAKKQLLEKGYSLFNSNYVEAVKNGEVEIASLFIDAGFSPFEKDLLGTPVLSLAVRERHIDMVRMLIERGAIIDATSKDRNYTALMDAAQIGELEIAKLLLDANANPNIQSKDGQTALILAVGRQDVSVIEILLKAHSDYNIKDSMGMSALDYVNLFRNEKILALFAKENT